jgi:predicted permease
MIALQVALACGLLALTMLLGRAAVGLRTVPWPFDPESIMTFEFEMSEPLASDAAARNLHLRSIASSLSATPGVTAAGFTTTLPGRSGAGWTVGVDTPASDPRAPRTALASVSPEFFAVIGAPARSGRLLTWQDDAMAPRVVVVNESFVRQFLSDRDPIGRRLFLGERDFTVVGVVPDAMARDVQDRDQDGIYASILQTRPYGIRIMASTTGDPTAIMPSLRAAIRAVDADLPLAEVFTLHEAVYRDKRVLDVLSSLFLVFGIGALSLTAIGLYGIVSFGVTQRTREIGIRMALGASRSDVLRLVAGQGGRHLLGGLIAGTALALGLSRAFAAAVEQLPAPDGPLLLLITTAIGVTTLVALLLPARRAVALPIVRALRGE